MNEHLQRQFNQRMTAAEEKVWLKNVQPRFGDNHFKAYSVWGYLHVNYCPLCQLYLRYNCSSDEVSAALRNFKDDPEVLKSQQRLQRLLLNR